jgi:hypothetical protein
MALIAFLAALPVRSTAQHSTGKSGRLQFRVQCSACLGDRVLGIEHAACSRAALQHKSWLENLQQQWWNFREAAVYPVQQLQLQLLNPMQV